MTQEIKGSGGAKATEKQSADALLKIRQARSYLMLHHPFFSVLALSLAFEETTRCDTMATDGRKIYYNVAFVLELSIKSIASVIAHECLHVALGHHLRRGSRDAYWWNVAADYCINGPLIESGLFELPDGGLYDEKYTKMSAEQVYADVVKTEEAEEEEGEGDGEDQGEGDSQEGEGEGEGDGEGEEGGKPPKTARPNPCGEVWDGTKDDGSALDADEIVKQEREIAARVFEAHAQEKASGKGAEGAFRGILEDKAADEVPWNQILHMHMQELIAHDTSFATPNRRFIHTGMYLPGIVKRPNGTMVFAVDTSGSLGQEELNIICGNVNQICDEMQPLEVIIIYCDYSINHTETFEHGEEIVMKPYGGGGTQFHPSFNWLEREGITPDVLVYFTDGWGSIYEDELDGGIPNYPVIWATTGRAPRWKGEGDEVFGEVIEIGRI